MKNAFACQLKQNVWLMVMVLINFFLVKEISFSLFTVQAKLDSHSKMKQAEMELQNLQETLEEEQEAKADVQKQLSAAKADAAQWRSRMENEAAPRIEELEEAK